MIFVAQVFGLFPISGVCSNNPKDIKFTWKSLRTWFSLPFLFGSATFSFSMLYQQSSLGALTPSNIIGFIFFGNCFLISFFFFRFSRRFGALMVCWLKVDKNLQSSNYAANPSPSKWSLKKKIKVASSVALTLAVLEHLMSQATHAQKFIYETEICNLTHNNIFKAYITSHLQHTFALIPYNDFLGFIAEYFNFSLTFHWSFIDIFIMVISIGISYNYDKINNRIKYFYGRSVPEEMWSEVRQNYNEISELLKMMNASLDSMIVLACCNDAYFIMVQVLNLNR